MPKDQDDRQGLRDAFDIQNEMHVHGQNWAGVFGGYFADPAIARPLVDALHQCMESHPPTVLVDIGGGTGFILSELMRLHPGNRPRLIDLDASPEQLSEEHQQNITKIQAMAQDVSRADLCGAGDVLMLTMRSVVQYLGITGAEPFLASLASLLEPGEFMVHQTHCFDDPANAALVSEFSQMTGIGKGAFHTDQLLEMLEKAGWQVRQAIPAPPLFMDSAFLSKRYSWHKDELASTRDLGRAFQGADAFTEQGDGFTIRIDYKVFTSMRK